MAASYSNRDADGPAGRARQSLPAPALQERLGEEISRAERHGTGLACLLVMIENLETLAESYGGELREQAPQYLAAALEPGLRRFDAIGRPQARELAIVLPGADGPRAEVVARRALERMRTIKVEAAGERMPLRLSVGLAAWRDGEDASELLQRARAAALASGGRNANGEDGAPPG